MFHWTGKNDTPLIRQSTNAECGLACIGMVASHYGHEIDLPTLRQKFSISSKGATLENLIDIAAQLHLGSRALKCDLEQLDQLRLPAILHWDLNHFVVLKSIKGDRVEIHDPAQGHCILKVEEVGEHFTGVALELVPTTDFSIKKEKQNVTLMSLLVMDKGYYKPIAQILLLTLFFQAFVLVSPYYIQIVIDQGVGNGAKSIIIAMAVGFALLMVFQIATSIFRQLLVQLLANVLTFDLEASLFHHLIRLPLSYFNTRSVGDVQQRFMSLSRVSDFFVNGIIEVIVDLLLVVMLAVVLFFYSPKLAGIVIAFLMLYVTLRLVFIRLSKRLMTELEIADAKESSQFLETLTAMQTIKVGALEIEREGSWRNLAARAINSRIRLGNINIAFSSISRGVLSLSYITIVAISAFLILDGEFTIGMLTAFIAYKGQFDEKFLKLINTFMDYKLLSVHLDRISDIALTPCEANLVVEMQSATQINGAIELNDISFRYSPVEPYVLNKISMSIDAGEFIAIKGPSGHGKTTLLKVIVGLLNPDEGEVLFDGKPIEKIGLSQVRKKIGVVMQEDNLMAGSIADNICLFDRHPDLDKIQRACDVASISHDIEAMPMQYNTLVGDMGSSLSGGQKQRIMIARALYREPKILILDEGTSQLDLATESAINNALKELKITRIACAHRPDTFAKADRIFTVLHGQLYDETQMQELERLEQ